jgi:hypothetical protein
MAGHFHTCFLLQLPSHAVLFLKATHRPSSWPAFVGWPESAGLRRVLLSGLGLPYFDINYFWALCSLSQAAEAPIVLGAWGCPGQMGHL